MALVVWFHCALKECRQSAEHLVSALARNGVEVRQRARQKTADAPVIVWVGKGGKENACQLIQEIRRQGKFDLLVIVDAGDNNGQAAWRLMKAGASDVLTFSDPERTASDIIDRLERWAMVDQLLASPAVRETVIGESSVWIAMLRQIVEVAQFSNSAVLLLGESGTGKELVARLVHDLDARSDKQDLIVLDCSTIMNELSGSEFFGHERGAFTSAVTARDGAFALADGGTLFLDEVGELPERMQAQLLRVLQDGTYKRVGGSAWQHSSFRLVCATNRDLWAKVRDGLFRADLYFRIAGFVCTLPPLRDRAQDIIPLAHHFVRELSQGREPPEMDAAVQYYLQYRAYPGNVRDLRQVVTRLCSRSAGYGRITVGCIPADERSVCPAEPIDWRDTGFDQAIQIALRQGVGLKEIGRKAEETAISIALRETGGNLQKAAGQLGVTDRALQLRRAAQRQA